MQNNNSSLSYEGEIMYVVVKLSVRHKATRLRLNFLLIIIHPVHFHIFRSWVGIGPPVFKQYSISFCRLWCWCCRCGLRRTPANWDCNAEKVHLVHLHSFLLKSPIHSEWLLDLRRNTDHHFFLNIGLYHLPNSPEYLCDSMALSICVSLFLTGASWSTRRRRRQEKPMKWTRWEVMLLTMCEKTRLEPSWSATWRKKNVNI